MVTIRGVLWQNAAHIYSVMRLGLLQALLYGAVSAPFLGVALLTYGFLLSSYDISYYLLQKPWQWWTSLAIVGSAIGVYLVIAGCLYVRLIFSVPILVFEKVGPLGALKKSWRITRHRIWEVGKPQAIWWLFITIGFLGMGLVIKAIAAHLLAPSGLHLGVILPVVALTFGVIIITDVAWLILGKVVHASL
ncbi:glycerophosphoryl diester phosphodiesterase membrane domain-containing protein, partial [Thermodesulfobacteriota bacterium]